MTQEQMDAAIAWFLHGDGPAWTTIDTKCIGPIASTFMEVKKCPAK